MNRTYIRKNITSVSIVLFVVIFSLIQLAEPAFLYEKDGSLRRFGLGTQKKNYYTYLVFDIYYCYIFIFICVILHIYT